MPKFSFTLTRDLTESVRVQIEADSLDEAHEAALLDPPKSGWETDDNPPQRPYLPDPDDFEKE